MLLMLKVATFSESLSAPVLLGALEQAAVVLREPDNRSAKKKYPDEQFEICGHGCPPGDDFGGSVWMRAAWCGFSVTIPEAPR